MRTIPYFQTTRIRVQTMLELSGVQANEDMVDLGAGDGRIVIAFAQKGALSIGFETDQSLAALAENNIRAAGAAAHATINKKNFWQEDLSSFHIVTCYPMPDIMEDLEKKLQNELQPGTRVLLNYYEFPHWECTRSKEHIYLYIK